LPETSTVVVGNYPPSLSAPLILSVAGLNDAIHEPNTAEPETDRQTDNETYSQRYN